ncbi:hypothetical protein F0L68_31820 [Solihabitans fulvus]|uniref:Uncharacterized protein n=1 Tax=Solihabitans fulvus TaxID=1892852 RepID=A0A5B2WSA2_9PSEU|nr:hypothetical protein [Solihabitans fulvus]KAA2253864.1 hypothetical protein F0L68_31820 [Solihabitans fulvus]
MAWSRAQLDTPRGRAAPPFSGEAHWVRATVHAGRPRKRAAPPERANWLEPSFDLPVKGTPPQQATRPRTLLHGATWGLDDESLPSPDLG